MKISYDELTDVLDKVLGVILIVAMCCTVWKFTGDNEESTTNDSDKIGCNAVSGMTKWIISDDGSTIMRPEAILVTNYVRSSICVNCGCDSNKPYEDGARPSCGMLTVYPPRRCEYRIVGTNITKEIVWKQYPFNQK